MKVYLCLLVQYIIGILLIIGVLRGSADAAVTFYPHLSIGNMYTDNVDLTADNEEYDFITTLSPGFDLGVTGQFSDLSITYTPTYASYLRFPENNTLRHNAGLSASRQITPATQLEFSNDFLYSEDPISDTDTTVRQGRNPYTANTAAFAMNNQFGPENSISLGYEYYLLNNTDTTLEDNEHYRPSIMMNYWLAPSRYGTESELSYTRENFDDSEDYNETSARFRLIRRLSPHFDVYAEYTHELTNYVAEDDDFQVFSPLAGFIWAEYVNYSLSASFGYFFQKNDHSEDDSGPVGTIESVYTWKPEASLTVSGNVGYDHASGGAENLGFNPFYDVTGIVTYPLTRHLQSNLFGGYRWNIYTDEEPDREDTLWRTGAGLRYQALPWMFVQMNYIFRELDSNFDAEDYVENRAEISVTMTPPQPITLTH